MEVVHIRTLIVFLKTIKYLNANKPMKKNATLQLLDATYTTCIYKQLQQELMPFLFTVT